MFLQRVIFETVPANAISYTRHGSGQLLSYDMIVGIKVGTDSVTFRHPDYDLQVDPGAQPSQQQIKMPALMAARLIPFARACFVPGQNYDGAGFTLYVSGLQASTEHKSCDLRLATRVAYEVRPMHCHVIGIETGEVVQPFIGLDGQRALSVLGFRGTFGISLVSDLMRVYGGYVLGEVDWA
jgi:hypothetical protein